MELKIPPVIQMLLVAITMWLLSTLLPSTTLKSNGILWMGGLFFFAGVGIALSGVCAFRSANTTVDPRSPEKTSSLVTDGIYRFSRNPMYLGLLLMLIGWAFILGNGISLILLPAFVLPMNRYQIEPEERYMIKLFNEEYQAYEKSVRRWI